MYRILVTLVICLVAGTISAQTYPTETEKFLKAFNKDLRGFNGNASDNFMLNYETLWLSESFPNEYRSKIYTTVEKMVQARMSVYPDIHDYLSSVFGFVKFEKPTEKFEQWHNTLEKMMEDRDKRRFKEFLSICGDYFSKNVFYSSPTVEWEARGGSFDFVFEKKPYLELKDVTLVGYSRGDSTVIKNTTGVYDILSNKWEGKGGIITWERVGLPAEETFAELTNYDMSVKSTYFSCDTVILTTPFFDKPLKGKLTENVVAKTASGQVDYPQFISFDNKLKIKEIVPQVDYVGGFMLKGGDFSGSGNINEPAQIIFYRNELPFVKLFASNYIINDRQILTERAEATIYISKEDSIYHPGAQLIYNKEKEELHLIRGKTGVSVTAFVNSYHQLDSYSDLLVWKRGSNEIRFNYLENSIQRNASFESRNFYSQRIYDRLMGMGGTTHPLIAINSYMFKYDLEEETEGKIASVMGYTVAQVKPLFLELAGFGFISYDTERGIIKPHKKLRNYILNRAGKMDYDGISFNSDLNQLPTPDPVDGVRDSAYFARVKEVNQLNLKNQSMSNAVMDLSTLDLTINGVNRVDISDAKNVSVFPADKKVIVKKNRDFLFNGWVNSGKLEVLLNEGAFSYERFTIHLMDAELARLRVKPVFGKSESPVRMVSHIKGLNGYIEVDDTLNKSGLNKDKHHYPILHSKKESYVFYNHPSIHRGAYDSSTFYFELKPFDFDSLSIFDEHKVAFEGKMYSSGIFPVFDEKIRIQDDYSFGFKRNAPAKGYDFYGTGANYSNEIRLSNRGLQGSGTIEFVTSKAVSDNFTFLPDSTLGIAQTYENKPQTTPVGFPDVEGKNIFVTYVPKAKILRAKTVKEPLYFFDKESSMNGSITVKPEGMTGRGYMYFVNAELGSKEFKYGRDFIDADTASFNLATMDTDELQFKTDNVNAHVSFADRKGEFKTNGEESYVEFPEIEYICFMDKFNWYMDNDDIELEKEDNDGISIETDLSLSGSNFYSIHPDQDSLNFLAPKALFSMKKKTVTCREVPYIDIADARIYPDTGYVVVRKKAKMDPLVNSEIVANYITRYHRIINATTEIKARRSYVAKGEYAFKDATDEEFIINFTNIYLDTTYQTRGVGEVKKDDDFRFSPEFDYYGKVNMVASEPLLNFDGATKINHECAAFEKNWMSFTADIDPKNIYIPVSENMKDLDGNPIAAGIVLDDNPDSLGAYTAFLSMKSNADNPDVISSNGFLHYNEGTKEFQIASQEKLEERSNPGNYISLHTESCTMVGEGKINFGVDLGPYEIDAIGYANYNTHTGATSFRWAGRLNHFFDQKILEKIAAKINEIPDLDAVDISLTPYEQSLASLIDQKTADKIKSDINVRGEIKKVEKEMSVPFYFADIKMKAVKSDNRFYYMSEGKLSISNMFDVPVLKRVPGNLIIDFDPRGGSVVHLNLELPGGYYYYFYYKFDNKRNGEMQLFTNDKSINETIASMKDDERKDKNFSFNVGTNTIYYTRFKRLVQDGE